MSMDRSTAGSPGPFQSSEQELGVLAGWAPFCEWGQSNVQCHESDKLAASHVHQGPGGGCMQSRAFCAVFLHLKQELFPCLSLRFSSDILAEFKALPTAVAIILAFLFVSSLGLNC